ncbi:MAG TPA: protein translocase subunit SecD [candidate division Zixibacteria bacterium]|nr:protein translocase subunit SecD [candidate division Zixibacteria bacterium]
MKNWRVGLTIILILGSLFALWDTFRLWSMDDTAKAKMATDEPGELLALQQKAIRLGLDLQGGIHVVLRVKLEEIDDAQRDDAVDRAMQIIRNRVDGLGVAEPTIVKQGRERIIVDLPGYTDAERAEELIGQTALLQFKLMETPDNASVLLQRLDSAISALEISKLSDEERARLEAGEEAVTEEVDLAADLLGDTVSDTAALFAFEENTSTAETEFPLTSRLEWALYSSRTNTNWPAFAVSKNDKEKVDQWLNDPSVASLIPIDVEFAWSTRIETRNSKQVYMLYMLKRKVQFLGKFLENIALATDNMGAHVVNFQLSGQGAARFSQLTGANIDKPLAIVLDNRVESAPIINSKIRQRGQITMGSSASFEDARNMEIVLKAGALPAPVEIIEKNVVGASLGADSIKKGFYSSLLGLVLVLLFIAIYYRLSGIIADIGLLFNIFFLLAVLDALGATLTMPGIAGIILTIGMSVDSNILIFERIREELRTGKTVRASIDAGYDRAFVAIFDSHVTTLITAGALFLLGSGPIKGFAVTLFWGIVISLYTAFVITKQVFDIRKGYRTLSI